MSNRGRVTLINGKQQAGDGTVQLMLGNEKKQFSAVLDGAEAGDSAVVEVLFTPDGTISKGVVFATLNLTSASPSDYTPVLESLIQNYFARVVSVTGGAVFCYGDF